LPLNSQSHGYSLAEDLNAPLQADHRSARRPGVISRHPGLAQERKITVVPPDSSLLAELRALRHAGQIVQVIRDTLAPFYAN
jgi:hypothetical protein